MKVPRSSLITPERSRELSQRSSRLLAIHLTVDYLIILSAIALCELYWSYFIYGLAVMIIGSRMVGIGSIAIHDGAHRLLASNRKLNDRLAKLLGTSVGAPLVVNFESYRDSHFKHHRCTNTDDDPEAWVPDQFYEMPRWKGALILISAISGILFLRILAAYIASSWRIRLPAIAVIITTLIMLNLGNLFLIYWVIPFATWGTFVNLVRALAEHYPDEVFSFQDTKNAPEIFRTRDILNSWFDQIFVATRGVNFHLSHHLVPNVPFYNLPHLQKTLSESMPYKRFAHVTHGYHQFLIEYFFRRADIERSSPASTHPASG